MATTASQTASEVVYSDRPPPLMTYLNPASMLRNLIAHKHLAWQFARRDIEAKYKAQRLGIVWAILTPLLLLSVYTFVFAVIFPNKWNKFSDGQSEPLGAFALSLFAGMLVFGLFRDMAAKAPHVVVNHTSYVKRVVFPLEVFALSELLTALVTFSIGACVWLIGWIAIEQRAPEPTVVLVPFILLPVMLAGLAISWFLSALGVFLRDIGNIVELAMAVLFFVSPIFFSLSHVPENLRQWLGLNPIARVIEDARMLAITGEIPNLTWWSVSVVITGIAAILGYGFFMKAKRAFADVI
ncbi:MAG: ABC transporter permease [Planctomycetes bacterium]|nr:ABC transporter permease [Planctomycetota bacterium]